MLRYSHISQLFPVWVAGMSYNNNSYIILYVTKLLYTLYSIYIIICYITAKEYNKLSYVIR